MAERVASAAVILSHGGEKSGQKGGDEAQHGLMLGSGVHELPVFFSHMHLYRLSEPPQLPALHIPLILTWHPQQSRHIQILLLQHSCQVPPCGDVRHTSPVQALAPDVRPEPQS